ncbi:hypothetical protein [Paenarthrobacter ureafaciens]|uniref:hypothetical protein n=1 Tax=Paenarthrobacter ureafaciens TaxID=37931 RepID=UPI0019176915|nr:hypothetical protein [Paenarthrobacter ureafaciens]QQQ62763.1 hypothetical protein JHQ56_02580 [Paenarthrobacter ureafaciens]
MRAPIPVVAPSGRFRAAVAELPVSTKPMSTQPGGPPVGGAVVVFPGDGPWWDSLLAAQDAKAAAVVVDRPQGVPPEAAAALAAGAVRVPVIVDRPLLRADVVADAIQGRNGDRPVVVTVECAASPRELPAALCDALRWAAILAGAPLRTIAGSLPGDVGVHLLEAGDTTVTVAVRVLASDAPPQLRVTALGAVRTEVESVHVDTGPRVTTTNAAGAMVAAKRYEGSARLCLRRALEAASSGTLQSDLTELIEDGLLASRLMKEHKQG